MEPSILLKGGQCRRHCSEGVQTSDERGKKRFFYTVNIKHRRHFDTLTDLLEACFSFVQVVKMTRSNFGNLEKAERIGMLSLGEPLNYALLAGIIGRQSLSKIRVKSWCSSISVAESTIKEGDAVLDSGFSMNRDLLGVQV